jgi:shikimate dehydrogenase
LKLAIIGNNLRYSVSPFMHEYLYKAMGLEASYNKINLKNGLDEWAGTKKIKNVDGFNVTVPFKESIVAYLDEVNPKAEILGAVNCVLKKDNKLIGFNTDWYGFTKMISGAMVDVEGKTVTILGAGGASRAAVFALAQLNTKRVNIIARRVEQATFLKDELEPACKPTEIHVYRWDETAVDAIESCYALVNTTPIGMKPRTSYSPIDADLLSGIEFVIDTVYNPLNTRLLSEAMFSDCQTVTGLDMLLYQALASVDIWFGPQDWSKLDFDAFREAVTYKITGFKRL